MEEDDEEEERGKQLWKRMGQHPLLLPFLDPPAPSLYTGNTRKPEKVEYFHPPMRFPLSSLRTPLLAASRVTSWSPAKAEITGQPLCIRLTCMRRRGQTRSEKTHFPSRTHGERRHIFSEEMFLKECKMHGLSTRGITHSSQPSRGHRHWSADRLERRQTAATGRRRGASVRLGVSEGWSKSSSEVVGESGTTVPAEPLNSLALWRNAARREGRTRARPERGRQRLGGFLEGESRNTTLWSKHNEFLTAT
ncbi:hypothetical protein EYF80_039341 [Liparis tanakae]|uniref:Uncharacterized protein n=1 Tax=Liparis tanakae TaxID=230148 RepID=A0A4Z2GCU9_9TELE|nr:hypothetical protein EYF80_039341 [Liparis tanakae]